MVDAVDFGPFDSYDNTNIQTDGSSRQLVLIIFRSEVRTIDLGKQSREYTSSGNVKRLLFFLKDMSRCTDYNYKIGISKRVVK